MSLLAVERFYMQPRTQIMGILNVTPDSFSDGGKFMTTEKAIRRAEEMVLQGADMIDIGGESTRPGAESISIEEEIHRVIPVIAAVKKCYGKNITLSIDSYKAAVVEEALKAGVTIVNSLGGFKFDNRLIEIIAKHECRVVIYHVKGTPKTMQTGSVTYKDVIKEIITFFQEQLFLTEKYGINNERFILDPGIGFGKTIEHNLTIIKNLDAFTIFDLPILIGVSRKSHLGALLKKELELDTVPDSNERLEASLAETAVAVLKGASIVRTHDILATKKFLTILDNLK